MFNSETKSVVEAMIKSCGPVVGGTRINGLVTAVFRSGDRLHHQCSEDGEVHYWIQKEGRAEWTPLILQKDLGVYQD